MWFNTSDIIGQGVVGFRDNIAGSYFLTLLLLIFGLIILGMSLRIGLVWILLFTFPLLIVFIAMNPQFMVLGGIFAVLMGIVLAYNFFFT